MRRKVSGIGHRASGTGHQGDFAGRYRVKGEILSSPVPDARCPMPGPRRPRRAFVLVQALIVIAGLVILLATLAANQRVALNAVQDRLRQRRATAAARAALATAMAAIQDVNINSVTQNDSWFTLGDHGNQSFDLGDGATYRIEIQDAGSRININSVTQAQLQTLPLTQEQIDSLLDWREPGQTARPDGGKDLYYNGLTVPYDTKLGPLTTLDELVLVKGWTAKMLYGPPDQTLMTNTPLPEDANGNLLPLASIFTVESGMPNTQATGAARVNLALGAINPANLVRLGVDQNTANRISTSGPYNSLARVLSVPGVTAISGQRLLDAVTVTPTTRLVGKININTASAGILETALSLPPDVASAIVTQQSAGFTSLGQLATIPGMSAAYLSQVADNVGVGSDTWEIHAYGESGGVGVAIEASVGKRNGNTVILNYARVNAPRIPTWWEWADEATETVDATAGMPVPATTGGSL